MITSTVTLSQLRALVATIEQGGIARAAARLGVAPSAVSQHLSLLERAVGLELLTRRAGPVPAEPTAAGTILLAHARDILRRLTVLEADAERLREARVGNLRLGCFMSAGARILPRVLAAVEADQAAISIELVERDADDELLQGLLAGAIDLAFVTRPVREERLMVRELLVDPHVLLVPAGHELVGAVPSVADLADLPLIGFRNDTSEEQRLEGVLRAHGLTPRVVLRTDNNLAIPELVARGLGCAVVPRLALPDLTGDRRVVTIPLDSDTIPARRICLCWHADRHLGPAAATVVDIAAAVCAELAHDALPTT